jgi:serine/threonine protein kinase
MTKLAGSPAMMGTGRLNSIASQIARYRILEEVGHGGMATVYRGVDPSLDREVAVKVLHAHLSSDEESRARFQREARAVARLHHPHIIEIFDFAESGDGPSYIVTEFIRGKTLKSFIEDAQAFFPEVAVMIALQLCEAVGHAHDLQIIHRDLKPENVMVDENGSLKLMDFGIAKVVDQQHMTLTGTILGSPAHMAPEMLEGKELDYRSDLFSIGTILYWLATGHLPFEGKNPHQILKKITEGDYPDPQQVNPTMGAELARVIRRALAHRPEDRFPSADSMQAVLRGILSELQIEDIDLELKYFFSNSKGYIDGFKQKLSRHLIRQGKKLLQEKKYRAALEALDRLLAFEPGHPEATALVDGVHRRRRWVRRIFISGTAAVFLLMISFGTLALLARLDPMNHQRAVLLPFFPWGDETCEEPSFDRGEAQKDAGEKNTFSSMAPDGNHKILFPKNIAHRSVAALLAHLPRQAIKIYTDPFFDQILIDGQKAALADKTTQYGQVFSNELPVGKHHVVIQRAGCQDDEFELEVPAKLASQSELEFRRLLRFRPATLVVETDVPTTGVWVNSIFKGTAAESIVNPIMITMEGRQGRRNVVVRLNHPELGALEKNIFLEAGKQTVLTAKRSEFSASSVDGDTP